MWDKKMEDKIDKLNDMLEKSNIRELSYIFGSRREIFRRNFLAGIARGLGMTIGLAIVSAILIYFLQKLVILNIPLIGEYLSDLIEIVERK